MRATCGHSSEWNKCAAQNDSITMQHRPGHAVLNQTLRTGACNHCKPRTISAPIRLSHMDNSTRTTTL
eukprot:15479246-Alexandrium_andersonii.AAC.1